MAGEDFEIVTEGMTLRVEGLARTLRQMEKAGSKSEDMRDLMHAIGTIVVHAAAPPTVSGRLAGTVRAGRGKTKAVVRAGGARAPYGGVVHYGWPAREIEPQPFLSDALATRRAEILRSLDAGIADLLRANNLM